MLLNSAHALSTVESYRGCLRRFDAWRAFHSLPLVVPSEDTILLYISYRSTKWSYSTLKRYVSAIGYGFRQASLLHLWDSFLQVPRILRGAKRVLGASSKPKFAISPGLLRRFTGSLMFRAAASCALSGLLRISELLSLQFGDISFERQSVVLNITASKTDIFRMGAKVVIGTFGDDWCPVRLLKKWIEDKSNLYCAPQDLVFPCNRKQFVGYIKKEIGTLGLDPKDYSSHSLRRGGATALFAGGVPSAAIMRHGRWKSEAFRGYIGIPIQRMAEFSKQMLWEPC